VKLKDIEKIIAGNSSMSIYASIFRVARLWICAFGSAPAGMLTLSDVPITGGIHETGEARALTKSDLPAPLTMIMTCASKNGRVSEPWRDWWRGAMASY